MNERGAAHAVGSFKRARPKISNDCLWQSSSNNPILASALNAPLPSPRASAQGIDVHAGSFGPKGTPWQDPIARLEVLLASYAWLQATLQGAFTAQAAFYPDRMEAFYLWRNVPKLAVMAEKRRVFEQARTVDIDFESPQIIIEPGPRSARMSFRKAYVIKGSVSREGEVPQELRWKKETDGWKIVSERDLRVIRQARRQQ
jgi:hypothetical protein